MKVIPEKRIEIQALKISQPAKRALASLGVIYLDELCGYSEKTLMDLHGFGKKGLNILKDVMKEQNLSFRA